MIGENVADKTAYRILRNQGITAVFGLRPVAEDWPYQVDGKGDELVEEASARLQQPATASLNRDRFNAIQRVALRGAEAIATVIDYNDQPDRDVVNHLILKCYSWHAALVQVVGPPTWAKVDGGDGNRALMNAASFRSA